MLRVSLKGMWAHKRRLFGTVFAVVLGVAFVAATLVLGDTMRAGFDDLFTSANEGRDAIVRSSIEAGSDQTETRALIDLSLVDTVRGVDGVRAAEPSVNGLAQLVGKDGKPLGGNGPPTLAASWTPNEQLNPWDIAEGRAPDTAGEVVVDKRAADDGDLKLGDTVTLLTPDPVPLKVVGILTIGGEDSLGPVTFAALTFDEAQQLFVRDPSKASQINVAAERGVSQDQLVANIERVLPRSVEAISGDNLTQENNEDINNDFLGFLEAFLLVFAGIALLVATFSIYNTFSIIIAQRTRESALLRAIGASRGQVLWSIGLESLMIGLIASLVGLIAGVALAAGLRALFEAAGFGLPAGALTVKRSTVYWSFAVGLLVTMLATLFPAIRGSRVSPMAALRDVAIDRTGTSRVRLALGLLFTIGGIVLVIAAVAGGGGIAPAGLGAVLTIVGIVVLGPVVARPAARWLGAPLPRIKRMTGVLARQNATRNPRRTAATASALMVGVAVVTLFTVFAASVKASIDDTVSKQFGGDLVIATQNFSAAGLSPAMTNDLRALPEVATATGQGIGTMTINGETEDVSNVEFRQYGELLDLGVQQGSVSELTDNQIAVSKSAAEDRHFRLGDTVTGVFPSDQATQEFTIGGIYRENQLAGDYLVSKAAWDPHATQPFDIVVMIKLADGVSIDAGKAATQKVADKYFAPDPQTRDEYVDTVAGQIDAFLRFIYVLLVLAIIIALMGIANTLSLSVYERIRELGLLRAVGQSRSQLRSMVRWESVIIALFGTVGGILLGIFLGWGILEVVADAEDFAAPFTIPFTQVVGVIFVGALVGLLAAWRPARRAAKLDILHAIAAE
jgi:putative ABC transport system permease protein